MSRTTVIDHAYQSDNVGESAPTFAGSIQSVRVMAAQRRLGLFPVETSITEKQQNYIFGQFKEHVKDTLASHAEIQREFFYQLMMSMPDANGFLNILAGWRSSASKTHEQLLDRCIRDFKTLYPEVYEFIDGQAPIHRP